jgi:hypothetical protein
LGSAAGLVGIAGNSISTFSISGTAAGDVRRRRVALVFG